jgi:uncharacterized protein (UPF0332 family)
MKDNSTEDYVKFRINRAHETLAEIKVLVENIYWNTAINRMYYACFYAVGALLVKNGITTSSHSGSRQKFGQLFVQPGFVSKDLAKHYAELFEKRHKGDYNDFFDFDQDTVLRLIEPTREFINRIDELLKA